MLSVELLFGRDIAGKAKVSDAQWADFAASAITPRFPKGFSVVDAQGQYLAIGTTTPIREPSKLVLIVAPDTPETETGITAIAALYKTRFAQESVGILRRPVCASF